MASADALHEVLARVVDFASALVKCDSCLIYVLEDEQLLEPRRRSRCVLTNSETCRFTSSS